MKSRRETPDRQREGRHSRELAQGRAMKPEHRSSLQHVCEAHSFLKNDLLRSFRSNKCEALYIGMLAIKTA
jgi:hypothetical protein